MSRAASEASSPPGRAPRRQPLYAVDSGARALSFIGLATLAFALALVTRADADLWGHVRFGLDLLRDRTLTSVDPYSFTQDKPWVNHEWLSELQLGWAYRTAGGTGLLVLKAILLWLPLVVVWRSLRHATLLARLVVTLLLVMGTIHMTSSARPQVWTFFCFTWLCGALMHDSWRPRWWLPLLFVVWVNCHGGWIVGLGVLGVWAAAETWESPRDWRRWAAVVAACTAATLVNPYGAGLWWFIASTVRLSRSITEWQSLWGTPFLNWVPWFVGVGAIGWMWRCAPQHRLAIAATLAMLAWSSSRVMRIESLFVAASALMLAPTIAARWPRRPGVQLPPGTQRVFAGAFMAVAMVVAIMLTRWAASCVPIMGWWAPDLQVMAILKQAPAGRLVTHFNWGQYALWHLGPRTRVAMDGRRETVYTDRRLDEYDAIVMGRPEGLALLAAWSPEYVWLPASEQAKASLVAQGYRIEAQTSRSWLAVRPDVPRLPDLPPSPVRPCFPG